MSVSPVFALITGASSGIGREIARAYAKRGVPLLLTARREDRLHALADQLRSAVRVEVLPADLADPAAAEALATQIQRNGWTVGTLVNNAGYGVPGRYLHNDWATHARFLQVMVTAVCELTWRLLPMIRASGQGRILNVASFAALTPSADGQTLYAASKSFMLRFSESLALENADCGVKVCALCPGFAWSEFHDVTGTRDAMSALPAWAWLQADAVAEYGIAALERGQVLAVPGWGYRLVNAALRLLPHAFALRMMARGSHRVRPLD
ncbi:SDR family NAD(P)-dependent oxidoreductase [Xanthomonas oryzae pv. oryzae]|uniref:SDR family NAD(P)-dependent oxidoreductase n=1 Tax=Xanthomonas oryzae TaxID=347 RepID=UPI000CA679AD|nr:SDR family NAD(P)-dependent oxidoreductase [Xanthomonas oryzae]PNR86705.1 dehydrogenase [Xanthomonas oryzae pv. oryzae]RBG55707.1 dehydrogenase [Xanthomonas oryzae pv. oryzae]RBL27888.1 dehydrogenase [Xanthomonas oryzae pv. oryzae]RBL52854.1 dehydrogenase [Xanthomonas oryzae pv. oryzae]UAD92250.1 SDR family NAD(P)-dependent oxidoreductase [Xanthomonas oryzae pv. oryzae]